MTELVLADRELDVMNVLWNRGSGTVAEVQEALDDDLAYTTVLTVLRKLEEKGYATHEEEGRAHRYRPAVERQRVRKSALERMRDRLFGGSPELLMAHMVDAEGLGPEELRRIRRLVDERLGGRGSAARGGPGIQGGPATREGDDGPGEPGAPEEAP